MNDRLRIFITGPLPTEALEVLRPYSSRLTVWKNHLTLTRRRLLNEVRDADGLLCFLTDEIDERLMIAARRLKVIANCAVGFDNVDVAAASTHGILVTNTPGVLTDATADLTWALLMAVARRIPEADRFLRAGEYREWQLFLMLGAPVYGKTIGIVGSGRVGTAVALRAKGFQMKILYTDTSRNKRIENEAGAKRVTLQALLRKADFVCIHVPYDKSTHHLIGRKELSLMKPSAILINTARGEIVDERALVQALKTGRIAGAGLDVYEHEPRVPASLRRLSNVVLLPHIGSATLETRTKMAVSAAENLVVALGGRVPPNLVNPEVLKTRR
jgi:D-3-phosphoglycerate dehydrogenase